MSATYAIANVPEMTQAELIEILDYDPLTGIFRWKVPRKKGAIRPGTVAGSLDGRGYVQISIFGKRWKAHRLAWLLMTGKPPDGEIDHIDGVRANNVWSNLRAASHKQNGEKIKLRADNTSGFRGVCFDKRRGRWMSKVEHHKKQYNLGYFDSAEQAAQAARAKRAQLFTHDHGRAA